MQSRVPAFQQKPLTGVHCRCLGGGDPERRVIAQVCAANKPSVAHTAGDWLGQGGLQPHVPPYSWHLDDQIRAARQNAASHLH
eukprot:6636209-Prymnesium_polylepis.2